MEPYHFDKIPETRIRIIWMLCTIKNTLKIRFPQNLLKSTLNIISCKPGLPGSIFSGITAVCGEVGARLCMAEYWWPGHLYYHQKLYRKKRRKRTSPSTFSIWFYFPRRNRGVYLLPQGKSSPRHTVPQCLPGSLPWAIPLFIWQCLYSGYEWRNAIRFHLRS